MGRGETLLEEQGDPEADGNSELKLQLGLLLGVAMPACSLRAGGPADRSTSVGVDIGS